ncbi:glyoxylase-like metal-dependent hydrolase (beta-lactamase superfamily II) [Streptomyces sp. B4I13]|uniref:MBL fold metallo-hydrolase n=1 Tax=Streptomyces sp. B4I13 TaxID=3042271 RepID=UPI002780D38C|nr:MBL fold metallo-hydrolase [Streptomyces sp. B4I13]MDQ0961845.1 glyoxylase-like metal-dependent hydrolase (beta-lactamase superfamily II) [Streptomyces sp. B4I13]
MTMTWEELGWERVAAGVGRCRLPGWDCTVGLVVGAGAALVIDAGSTLAEGALLRAQAEELAGGRVTHLALTHPHFDHVLGAAAFAGAEVFGAVGIDSVPAGELREDAVRQGVDEAAATEAADTLVRPRHFVSGEWTLDLGEGRQVLLANVGPAHSAHDLVVLVPGAEAGEPETVFCGDLVEESGDPQAGPDAVPSRWPATLDRLLDLGGEDARYVPGHGAVVDAAFVRAQRDALAERFGVSP